MASRSPSKGSVSGLHLDQPIEAASKDILNRGEFVKRLASYITNSPMGENLVISINAKWGDGKTSVVNMALKQLSSDYIITVFNPWYIPDQQHLTRFFFREVSKQIKLICAQRRKAYYDAAGYTFQTIGMACTFLGVLLALKAPPAYVGLKALGKSFDSLGKAIKDASSSDLTLEELKNEVSKKLKESKKKLLIIVDDIDRLNSQEICHVLQLIKGTADFKNTIYILAFDKTVVAKALEQNISESGSTYLEKIVQIDLNLPLPERKDLNDYLTNNLDTILTENKLDDKFEESHWDEVFTYGLSHFFTNLRQVNRFLNSFIPLHASLGSEIDFADLVTLEAIRTKNPSLYEFIKHNKELCTISLSRKKNDELKEFLSLYQKMISLIPSNDVYSTLGMLGAVFPSISDIKNNIFNHDRSSLNLDWYRQGRLCHREKFDIFFLQKLPQGELPFPELKSLFAPKTIAGFKRKLDELMENYEVSSVIDALRIHTDKFQLNNIPSVIKALTNITPYLSIERTAGSLSLSSFHKTVYLISDLFGKLPQTSKSKKHPTRLSVTAHLLRQVKYYELILNVLYWGLTDKEEKPFSREDAKKLWEVIKRRVVKDALSKMYNPNFDLLLDVTKVLSPTDFRKVIENRSKTKEGFLLILRAIPRNIRVESRESVSSFHPKVVADYFPDSKKYLRITNRIIKQKRLFEDDKKLLKVLKASLQAPAPIES